MAPNGQSQTKKIMQPQKRTHFIPKVGVPAISSLQTPIIRIENHRSQVLSCEFHPTGKYILSSNSEGSIHVCDIYGTFSKMMILQGHTGAVMETHFSRDGLDVYSCSADGTLGIWDTFRGIRKFKFEGHSDAVNCVQRTKTGYPYLCSGSKDGSIRVWDIRDQRSTMTLENDVEVTTTCFSETGQYVFSGGCENDIKIWDLRKKELLDVLSGHKDIVSGVSLSPCGKYLLSHSTDNSLRIWDVHPNADSERYIRWFPSNQDGADSLLRCNWSKDGSMISAGTVERDVYVWDPESGEIIELPGHTNSINDVAFHPSELVLVSASNDTFLFLHEINDSY